MSEEEIEKFIKSASEYGVPNYMTDAIVKTLQASNKMQYDSSFIDIVLSDINIELNDDIKNDNVKIDKLLDINNQQINMIDNYINNLENMLDSIKQLKCAYIKMINDFKN